VSRHNCDRERRNWKAKFMALFSLKPSASAGTITMANGATERIRCKAAYTVNATGKAVQQTLRCASDNYRVEISSTVVSDGGSLSGSWAEATRGVSGNISGRASGAEIVANVAGAGFTARLDVRTNGKATRRHRGVCRVDRFAQTIRLSLPAISRLPVACRVMTSHGGKAGAGTPALQLILRMEAAHE
jgi:hypothetical protein